MTQQRRRSYRTKKWWLLALATLALVLVGCSTESGPDNNQNSLRPSGKYAKQIDNLFTPIFWVAVAVGVFIIGAVIFVAVRFRHRKGGDDRPKQIHGSTPLEIGWTVVPALILAVIAVPTVSTIFSLAERPADPIEITVVGKQWWWQFDYGKSPDGAGVVTADEMHIPTGRDVLVTLTACDTSLPYGAAPGLPGCNVIHSFWVPELAGKRDVVPGHLNQLKIKTDKPGTYLGQCAEYCGLSHANMRFRVVVQSPEDYDAWLAGQREAPAVALADSGAAAKAFAKFNCSNCHTTSDSSSSTYGPNLTHLASRSTFASGYYELTRPKLIQWLLNAPSLIPMQSQDCRLGPPGTPGVTCVGMPSFTKNTPKGQQPMTQAEAEALADYLLSLK